MERIRKAIDHGRDVVVEFAKRLQEPCGRVNKNPGLLHRLEMEISRLRIEREQELHGIEVERCDLLEARTQITTQMRDLEFRLAGIRSRLRELEREKRDVYGRYREKILPLKKEIQTLHPQDPLPTSPSMGRGDEQ
jgi:chromosome segregation ATPase